MIADDGRASQLLTLRQRPAHAGRFFLAVAGHTTLCDNATVSCESFPSSHTFVSFWHTPSRAIDTSARPPQSALVAEPAPSNLLHDLPPLGLVDPSPIVIAARRRAITAFTACAMGLWLARDIVNLASSLWLSLSIAAGALTLIIAVTSRPRLTALPLALALLLLAGGVYTFRVHEPPRDSLLHFIDSRGAADNPIPIRIRGLILDDTRESPRPRTGLAGFIPALDSARATLRIDELSTDHGWQSVSGRSWLRIQHPLDSPASTAALSPLLRAGDRVELTGLFSPILAPENPGQTDLRPWAAARGFVGSIKVPDPTLIANTPAMRPSSDTIAGFFLRIRATALSRASAMLGPEPTLYQPSSPGRTLLADLLLGQDNPADPHLQQAFTRLGLAHILAISGFHLVVLAGVTLRLIALTGDRGRLEPLFVAVVVTAYLLIVPASAPVTRAGVMVLALLAAEIAGRRYDRLTILAWTAIAMLIWQPTDLWSLGFQLSYGLTATLLWLGDRFHAAIFGIRLRGTLDRRRRAGPIAPGWPTLLTWVVDAFDWSLDNLKRLISTSILCWLVAAPIIAWHTGLASPLAVLTTVIITPIIIVLLWAGFVLLFVSALWPALGALLGSALIMAGDLCAGLVDHLDALPGVSLRIPAFSLALAVVGTSVVIYWARFAHRRDLKAWLITTIVITWAVIELARPFQPRHDLGRDVLVRADVLSVGDGACTIIRTPHRAILWDCGSTRPAFGRLTLPRAARSLGSPTIHTAIISHSDLRHFSAIADAAQSIGLREVLVAPALLDRARDEPQGPAAAALRLLTEQHVAVRAIHAGEEIDLGSCALGILSPPADTNWTGDDQRSLIAIVETSRLPDRESRQAEPSLLLTGQLSDEAASALISTGLLPSRPVLILSGRGSARALHELLIASDPRAILASNADPIDFGPIWAGEATILQTSTSGVATISITTRGGFTSGTQTNR